MPILLSPESPGLGQEVRQICLEVGLPDATKIDIEADEVKKCISVDHLKQLKVDMGSQDKLKELSNFDTRVAQGWKVEECRMAYRLQTNMFDCRANMPSRYKRDLKCRACRPDPATGLEGVDEKQDHLEVCVGYSELWKGLGPMTPLSRVRYFIRVKNRRTKSLKL